MKKTITTDVCKMEVYENYVVVVMNEGVNLTPSHNEMLLEVTSTYFSDRPFVYITHRVNSYSVDPKIYYETAKIKNLIGLAVVSGDYKAKFNAKIEKMFFNKPFEIFTKMEDAVNWAKNLLA